MFGVRRGVSRVRRDGERVSAELAIVFYGREEGEAYRWLKANTVKRRTHSLFRQGLMLYHHLPNWPEDRSRPLMEKFGSMLAEQRVFNEIFGVI